MGFQERYQGLLPGLRVGGHTNNLDFWGITFGRPTAFLLLLLIGDISWMTPNILTHLSNICIVAGSLLMLQGTWPMYVIAALLLNVALTFDCADGQLARYRKNGSLVGSYYDKVTDHFGAILIYSTLAWTVFERTGHAWYFLFAIAAVGGNIMIGYVKWIVTAHNKFPQPGPEEPEPGRLKTALRVLFKIVHFRDPDIFLWVGLTLILNRPEIGLILMGSSQMIVAIAAAFHRGWLMSK